MGPNTCMKAGKLNPDMPYSRSAKLQVPILCTSRKLDIELLSDRFYFEVDCARDSFEWPAISFSRCVTCITAA